MDSSLINLFTSLTEKIGQFKQQKVDYLVELRNLRAGLEDVQVKVEQSAEQNKVLQDKYNNQVLKKAFEQSSTDNVEAKLRIVSIIKEIDRCINLLSR